jgi:hypothetical protein
MVSIDNEYKFVSEQVRFHVDKIFEAFKIFIQPVGRISEA